VYTGNRCFDSGGGSQTHGYQEQAISAWDAGTNYAANAVVSSGGITYKALATHPSWATGTNYTTGQKVRFSENNNVPNPQKINGEFMYIALRNTIGDPPNNSSSDWALTDTNKPPATEPTYWTPINGLEYIQVGTNSFEGNATAPMDVVFPTTTVINPTLFGQVTVGSASLSDGAFTADVIGVSGARLGDHASVSISGVLPNGITLSASVTASNEVTVVAQNESGGTASRPAGTYYVTVTKRRNYANY
jgi:hypothetical protein